MTEQTAPAYPPNMQAALSEETEGLNTAMRQYLEGRVVELSTLLKNANDEIAVLKAGDPDPENGDPEPDPAE